MDDFPLILIQPFDFRKPQYRENKSSIFLRFTYGTLENKTKLFEAFEQAIKDSGMPYEREYPEKDLGSLSFEIQFENAYPHDLM